MTPRAPALTADPSPAAAQPQDVMALLVSTFEGLQDPAEPHFQACLQVLQTAAQVKCCLLVLDLGDDPLLCSFFSTLLDTIK